jgi:hypothetical protein
MHSLPVQPGPAINNWSQAIHPQRPIHGIPEEMAVWDIRHQLLLMPADILLLVFVVANKNERFRDQMLLMPADIPVPLSCSMAAAQARVTDLNRPSRR